MTLGANTLNARKVKANLGAGQRKAFVPPLCARCGRYCQDTQGNPRYDVLWPLQFVCLDGCPRPIHRRAALT
jgi:hypothetical protein